MRIQISDTLLRTHKMVLFSYHPWLNRKNTFLIGIQYIWNTLSIQTNTTNVDSYNGGVMPTLGIFLALEAFLNKEN